MSPAPRRSREAAGSPRAHQIPPAPEHQITPEHRMKVSSEVQACRSKDRAAHRRAAAEGSGIGTATPRSLLAQAHPAQATCCFRGVSGLTKKLPDFVILYIFIILMSFPSPPPF